MSPSDRHCDALIVGAGPAGTHLAWLLAARGIDVAIIERQDFPRDKVCGGGVSRKALELLGIDLGPVVQKTIRGAVLSWRNETATVKDMTPPAACTVLRSEFDDFLLRRACGAGARFHPATAFVDLREAAAGLVVATDRGEFRCRRLFAADGANSAVRDRVFGRGLVHYVPALEALVQLDDEALARFGDRAVFDFAGTANGYGWIFPKRDHANVGVYSPFGGRGLRASLEALMARYAPLRGAGRVDYRGWIVPLANCRDEYARGRVSLLGDAAGLAEALFGEGIYFALRSAQLAAQAVTESGLDNGGERYCELLRRQLCPELRTARRMAGLLYRVPQFSFRHLVLNERINDDFAGLISGTMSYRRCLRRTLAGFPRWLLPSRPPGPAPTL